MPSPLFSLSMVVDGVGWMVFFRFFYANISVILCGFKPKFEYTNVVYYYVPIVPITYKNLRGVLDNIFTIRVDDR